MEKEKKNSLSKISDKTKINIARWWFAGAMYFMFIWGLFGESDPLDQMLFAGIAIGVGHIFVLHPLVYSMFDVERKGKLVNKKYYDRTIIEGVVVKTAEIFKCILCSFFAGFTYVGINYLLRDVFGFNVFFSGEPITYGLFFLGYYLLISKIAIIIVDLFIKIKDKKTEIKNKGGV